MRTGISVLTTPRRPQYLAETLRLLDAAGAPSVNVRLVVTDGWQRSYVARPPGWILSIAHMEPQGVRPAMRRVLEAAVARGDASDVGAAVDMLLYLEDDCLPAPDAIPRAFALPFDPSWAMLSLYDHHEFPGAHRAEPGVYEVPLEGNDGTGLHSAVALLIPRRVMEYVIDQPDDWRGPPGAADNALAWWLRDSPWQTRGVAIPSLFDHRGTESSMGHHPGQRAARFDT